MILSHRLDGRLGNILSEVFLIFYFAQKHNINFTDIVFNKDKKIYGKEEDANKQENFSFSIEKNISMFQNIKNNLISQNKFTQLFKDVKYQTFKVFKDDFKPFEHDKLLIGEFCPIKFAIDIFQDSSAIELYKQLFYVNKLVDKMKTIYDFSKDILGISVRRGDFLTWPGGRFQKFVKSKEDYIDKILKFKYDYIICFSDDIEWCKNNFKNVQNIIFHENMKPYEDLLLLSLCHNIIANANSTFSTHAKIFNRINYNDSNVILI